MVKSDPYCAFQMVSTNCLTFAKNEAAADKKFAKQPRSTLGNT